PLQDAMSDGAGVLRNADGLAVTGKRLADLASRPGREPRTEAWEATNLLTVASALTAAASARAETRGSHWREDFPDTDDETWRGHLDTRLAGATLTTRYVPEEPHDRE
ncbi:MAG: L-aspartate oxidase, partial [Actinomycetes bacterium]